MTGVIGLISDTHGLLRESAVEALAGCDLILHAGDIGREDILVRLRSIAPVVAVRGNIDTAEWAKSLPETAIADAGGIRIFMRHDLHQLDVDPKASGFGIVVSGHSHKAARSERDGVLYLNPGSAGPRRFRLPVTLARLGLRSSPWKIDFIELADAR